MIREVILVLLLLIANASLAHSHVVNVYSWANDIPNEVIQGFEKETGIKVNYSSYESNEELYAKIRAIGTGSYDVIEPSNYYVARMVRQGMLQAINIEKLQHYKNLDSRFVDAAYDPNNHYSIPYFWGLTGIFINRRYFPDANVTQWSDLWQPTFKNTLLLLDDAREVFSMALISLGYPANDANPQHIKQAYEKLTKLWPNIKLFNTPAVISMMTDDDATAGMAWNANFNNAHADNKHLQFIFPKDGFVIWVDTFAIPKGAPHVNNAYRFLDYLMRAEVAKVMSMNNNEAIANIAARQLLPPRLKNNPILYPNDAVLKRGTFQTDLNDEGLAVYEKYWELLKLR